MGCNTNLETHINALDSTSQVPFPSHFPLTITDSSGQPITFAQPPERIIVLDSASIEILFSINEGHRIVGTHSFVTYPDEVKTIPKVGNAFEINFERIVELNPDLIFIFYDRFLSDLKRLGFNVLFLKSADLNLSDISNQILLWGQITGNTPKAIEKAIEFNENLEAIENHLSTITKGPTIYHHTERFWTPGKNTLTDNIYKLLKAQNIASGTNNWHQISPEIIVARDPQIIITTEVAKHDLTNNPAFSKLSAIRNNQVFTIEAELVSIAGPRITEDIMVIAKHLYPDIFND